MADDETKETSSPATADEGATAPTESPATPDTAEKARPAAKEEAAATPSAAGTKDGGQDKPSATAAPAKPARTPKSDAPKSGGEGKTDTRSAIELLLDPGLGEQQKIVKAKGSKNITSGIVHILATFNNTIVSITDHSGNVIGWSSAGKCGFKGSRKSTAYAAQMVAQDASRQAMGHGLKEVEVKVKGPGSGRESAVRALQAVGLDVTVIRDVTPVPHNGCRPPKQRRV